MKTTAKRASILLGAAASALLSAGALFAQDEASKEPPKGAPWTRDFFAARAQALEAGKPIFLYSTKTY